MLLISNYACLEARFSTLLTTFLSDYLDWSTSIGLHLTSLFWGTFAAGRLLGILVTKCAEIGAITPQVGLNIFVVKNTVPEIDIMHAFRGAIPFVLVELLIIGLLVAFNDIALILI